LGEIMSTAGNAAKLGGLVIDACVRDGRAARQGWVSGVCPRALHPRHGEDFAARGWINHPLLLGDVTVEAGDLIVATPTASSRSAREDRNGRPEIART